MLRFEKRHRLRFRYAEICGKDSRYRSPRLAHIYDVRISYVSRSSLTVKALILTLRRLMSYIYGTPIVDVSRSHTTTQHSR